MYEIVSITPDHKLIYRNREEADQLFKELDEPSFLNRHWHVIMTSLCIFSVIIPTAAVGLLIKTNVIGENNPIAIIMVGAGVMSSFMCMCANLSFSPRTHKILKMHDELNHGIDLPMTIMRGEHTFLKGFNPYDAHMTPEDENAYVNALLDTTPDSDERAVAVHTTLAKTYIKV